MSMEMKEELWGRVDAQSRVSLGCLADPLTEHD